MAQTLWLNTASCDKSDHNGSPTAGPSDHVRAAWAQQIRSAIAFLGPVGQVGAGPATGEACSGQYSYDEVAGAGRSGRSRVRTSLNQLGSPPCSGRHCPLEAGPSTARGQSPARAFLPLVRTPRRETVQRRARLGMHSAACVRNAEACGRRPRPPTRVVSTADAKRTRPSPVANANQGFAPPRRPRRRRSCGQTPLPAIWRGHGFPRSHGPSGQDIDRAWLTHR